MAKRNTASDGRGGGGGGGGGGFCGTTGGGTRFHTAQSMPFRGANYLNIQNEFSDCDIPTRSRPNVRRFCPQNDIPPYLPPQPPQRSAPVPPQAEACQRDRLQQMRNLAEQRQQRQNSEQSRLVAQGARMGNAADARRQTICSEECEEESRANNSRRPCPSANRNNARDSDDYFGCSDSDPSRDQSRGIAMQSPMLNQGNAFNYGPRQQSPMSPQFIPIRNDSYSTGDDPTGDDELMNILCGRGASPQGRMPRGIQNNQWDGNGSGRGRHDSCFSDSDAGPRFNMADLERCTNRSAQQQSGFSQSRNEFSDSDNRPANLPRPNWDPADPLGERLRESRYGDSSREYTISPDRRGGAPGSAAKALSYTPKGGAVCQLPCNIRQPPKRCATCDISKDPLMLANQAQKSCDMAPVCKAPKSPQRGGNYVDRQGPQAMSALNRGVCDFQGQQQSARQQGPQATSTPNRAICDFQEQQQGPRRSSPPKRAEICPQQQGSSRQSPNRGSGKQSEAGTICGQPLPTHMTSTPKGRGFRTGYSPRQLMPVREASDDSADQNFEPRNAYPCSDDFGAAAADDPAAWNAARQRANQTVQRASPGQACEQPPPQDARALSHAYDLNLLREIQDIICQVQQLQMESLVKDQYCPGVIQETINGCENFNAVAFDLVFGECDLPEQQPEIDPISLIEAFDMRIDYERCQLSQQEQPGDLTDHSIAGGVSGSAANTSRIDQSFKCKYKTELNDALQSFLKAEELYAAENPAANQLTFDAEIKKAEVMVPGKSQKVRAFTGSTVPKQS